MARTFGENAGHPRAGKFLLIKAGPRSLEAWNKTIWDTGKLIYASRIPGRAWAWTWSCLQSKLTSPLALRSEKWNTTSIRWEIGNPGLFTFSTYDRGHAPFYRNARSRHRLTSLGEAGCKILEAIFDPWRLSKGYFGDKIRWETGSADWIRATLDLPGWREIWAPSQCCFGFRRRFRVR